ncbi:hypothetical protein KY290_010989 [Solanum tuberosum]|uniref:Tf2-1-like SH3-like domain-containing protein n=1 Tax=Solanum tuberosum TaxID=4113 RepID=A0ABQ7W1Y0_SOLTU|nr:hypothetical protein KY290_010989 [Solanum tuberosum]
MADYQEKFEQIDSQADLAIAMSLSWLNERKGQPFSSQLLDGCISKTTDYSPPQRTRFFNLQDERREGLRVVVETGERVRSPRQCEGVSIWFGPLDKHDCDHKIVLEPWTQPVVTVMTSLHNQGHEGYQKSLFRIARDFHWIELFLLSGTKLCFSLTYHPQSDGQTKVVNRTVEIYLRCFTSAHPTKWMDWLSWVGDRVLLKLQPYKELFVCTRRPQKLLSKLYGPYKIEQRIGLVAYKLEFPPGTKLHPVFHVSKLKLFHEEDFFAAAALHSSLLEVPSPHPITVLEHQVVRNVPEVLIHWQHTSPAEVAWETISSIHQCFPHFPLEDKHDFKGESNVSTPLVYQLHMGDLRKLESRLL